MENQLFYMASNFRAPRLFVGNAGDSERAFLPPAIFLVLSARVFWVQAVACYGEASEIGSGRCTTMQGASSSLSSLFSTPAIVPYVANRDPM